ncbi:MAG: PAC2 family protein [Bacillota bacterium]
MAHDPNDLRDPWLVAVWPGMGSIALLAGSYLLQELNVRRVAELGARDYFEIQNVDVKNGLASIGRLPRSVFFEWRNPRGEHDLLLFAGEAQPTSGGYEMCQKIIDYAMERGVKRFFTFAAMATQLTPGTTPRVFAVATDTTTLQQVQDVNVEVLEDGQITGLNGLLLAAGAERGLHGTCLLGELPYFAVGVPNPRAAKAVLERFTELANIQLDFTDLEQQAQAMDENLEQLVEQMNQSAGEADEEQEAEEGETAEEPPAKPQPPAVDPRTQRRIEALFERARQDRSKAFELKRELDRLGVFKQYEDRFLDLFRNAQ